MAGERYGRNSSRSSRNRTNTEEKVIVNDSGAFAAPASLQGVKRRSLLDETVLIQEQANDAPSISQDSFIFDDDPSWKQSISDIPIVPRQVKQEQQPNLKPPKKTTEKQSDGKVRKKRKNYDKNSSKRSFLAYVYVVIITVCVLAMGMIAIMMMPQTVGYFWKDFGPYAFINGELLRYNVTNVATYKQYYAYMGQNVIYPGIYIDGIHVGDKTVDEARELLTASGMDVSNAFSITVAIGDKTWPINPSNVPAMRNLGNVLEKAYAIGRTNTTDIQTTTETPFRERTNLAIGLRENGVNLTTTASYDHKAVQKIVDEIEAFVTRDPIDAQITSFDYATKSFAFSEAQPGVTLDAKILYDKIIAALDNAETGTVVTTDPIISQPTITKEELAANFNRISAYTTNTTSESNRNTNIDLACKAINGKTLLPGEVFSFNETTGQRTTAKGYQSAGAIAAGQSIEEVGGGICQVSSTLFNAVARANLEIVYRSPHAWPSTYVNRGEDATVNWPNLDFKFKNNTAAPVFIITYYHDRKMSAEIWGMTLGEGVSIELESNVIKTMQPVSEPSYVFNAALPYGTTKTTVKSRTGYVVETYQIWYKDGVEYQRELYHTSTYKAYQQVVEYNE